MVDFTVYNANVNLFCAVRLAFEFQPTGGLLLSSSFRTVKVRHSFTKLYWDWVSDNNCLSVQLLRYVGRADYAVFSFEIIFVCFVIYYMVEEVMEIRKVKLDYFNSAWNIMDLIVILISLFNIIMAVYTEIVVTDLLKVYFYI